MCSRFLTILHRCLYIRQTLKTPNDRCSKTNCMISFKFTVFLIDTHRYLHINFLSNWISFKVAKIVIKLTK